MEIDKVAFEGPNIPDRFRRVRVDGWVGRIVTIEKG